MLLALAVGALLLEGAITDWSVLLVARDPDAGAAVGASAVVVINLTMAVSRTSAGTDATRGDGVDPHRRPRVPALVRPFPPDERPPVSRG